MSALAVHRQQQHNDPRIHGNYPNGNAGIHGPPGNQQFYPDGRRMANRNMRGGNPHGQFHPNGGRGPGGDPRGQFFHPHAPADGGIHDDDHFSIE